MPVDNSKTIQELLENASVEELKVIAGALTPYVAGKNPPQVLILSQVVLAPDAKTKIGIYNEGLLGILEKYGIISVTRDSMGFVNNITAFHSEIAGDIGKVRVNGAGLGGIKTGETYELRYLKPTSQTAIQRSTERENAINSKIKEGQKKYTASPFDAFVSTYLYKLWDRNADNLNQKVTNGYVSGDFYERFIGYFNDNGEFVQTGGIEYVQKNTDATDEQYERAEDAYDDSGKKMPILYETQFDPYLIDCIGENCIDPTEIDYAKTPGEFYFMGDDDVKTTDLTLAVGSVATKTPLNSQEYITAASERRATSPCAEVMGYMLYTTKNNSDIVEFLESNGIKNFSDLKPGQPDYQKKITKLYEKSKKGNAIGIKMANVVDVSFGVVPFAEPTEVSKWGNKVKLWLVNARKFSNFGIDQVRGLSLIGESFITGDSEKAKEGGKVIAKALYTEYIKIPAINAISNTIGSNLAERFVYKNTPTTEYSKKGYLRLRGGLTQQEVNKLILGDPIGLQPGSKWQPRVPGLGINLSELRGYEKYSVLTEGAAGSSVTLSVTRGEKTLLGLRSGLAAKGSSLIQLGTYVTLYGPSFFGYTTENLKSELSEMELANRATWMGMNRNFAVKTKGYGVLPGYGFDYRIVDMQYGLNANNLQKTTISSATESPESKGDMISVANMKGQKFWMVRSPSGQPTMIPIPFGLVGEAMDTKTDPIWQNSIYVKTWESMSWKDKVLYWAGVNISDRVAKIEEEIFTKFPSYLLKKAVEAIINKDNTPTKKEETNENERDNSSMDLHDGPIGDRNLNNHLSLLYQIEFAKNEYKKYESMVSELVDEGLAIESGTSSIPNIPIEDINEEVSFVTNVDQLNNPYIASTAEVATPTNSMVDSNDPSCFPHYIQIMTPMGEKNISNISIGDIVISFDSDGNYNQNRVLHKFEVENKKIYRYCFENEKSVDCTSEHPFLTPNGEFVPIGQLNIGDYVVDYEKHNIKLLEIIELNYDVVYNITVEGDSTYFANSFAVHNKPVVTSESYRKSTTNLRVMVRGVEEEGERIRREHEEWIEENFPGALSAGFPWIPDIEYPLEPDTSGDEAERNRRLEELSRRRQYAKWRGALNDYYANKTSAAEVNIDASRAVNQYINYYTVDPITGLPPIPDAYDNSARGTGLPIKISPNLQTPNKKLYEGNIFSDKLKRIR